MLLLRLKITYSLLLPHLELIKKHPELRAKLQPAAWGQSQIVDASQLIVFANITNFGETEIDVSIANTTKTRGLPADALKGYGDFMKSKIVALPEDVRNTWASKQTYLALRNLMNAASELKIDVTPMEGFEPAQVNEILGLGKLGLNATLLATIGYRHEEDATQHYAKVRKSNEELFINL